VRIEVRIRDLILAVLAEVQNLDPPAPSKTKLLKLLYLIDLETARSAGGTATDWKWIFLHFGPWAPEYDSTLEQLAKYDDVVLKGYGADDRTTLVITQRREHDASKLDDGTVQNTIARVLSRWGRSELAEILNFVYFETEPMQGVERLATLDFTKVPRGRYPVYRRVSSEADAKTLRALRAKINAPQRSEEGRSGDKPYTPPRYDDEVLQALASIEDD
jgi:hypothetical protein